MEKKRFQVDKYISNKRRKTVLLCGALFVFFLLSIISLLIGQYGISVIDTVKILLGCETIDGYTAEVIKKIIVYIRVPRTLTSILVGGALAVAGVTYQCVFRNMLVSQDVLGVSTGACVGAAMAIVLGWSATGIQLLSFLCGIGCVILVGLLAKMVKADKTLSLILAGVLISGLMSSVLGYIKYTANQETQLPNIIYWIMGDVSSVTMKQLGQIVIPAVVCIIIILTNKWKLNYFVYSDNEAESLGINISIYRTIFIICATVLVSLAISVSGAIGWIGLVIPQLARTLVGTNNRDSVPLSFVLGADFLLLVDVINRMLSAAELPVSILTGLIGTPLFVICLLLKQRKEKRRIGC